MVRVDSKGRIVLPQAVRDRLGIEPGTEVTVRAENGTVVVEPDPGPDEVIDRMERLISTATSDRDAPAEQLHPIAAAHADTIRRQANNDTTDE